MHNRNTALWAKDGDPHSNMLSAVAVSDWRPSTNIAHAWEVVERMKMLGFFISLRVGGL
jgi:hypothetical protein